MSRFREIDHKVIGGRRIARGERQDDSTGRTISMFREVVAPPECPGDLYKTGWSSDLSAAEQFNRVIAANKTAVIIAANTEADALDAEARRLGDAGFASTAATVRASAAEKRKGITPGRPDDLFATGDVIALTKGIRILEVLRDEIEAQLSRHVAGDAGHGKWADVEIGDAERYCPALFDVQVQNRVALETGDGLIRSSYDLYRPGQDDPVHERGFTINVRRRNRGEALMVATLLVPDRDPVSLVYTSLDGVTL